MSSGSNWCGLGGPWGNPNRTTACPTPRELNRSNQSTTSSGPPALLPGCKRRVLTSLTALPPHSPGSYHRPICTHKHNACDAIQRHSNRLLTPLTSFFFPMGLQPVRVLLGDARDAEEGRRRSMPPLRLSSHCDDRLYSLGRASFTGAALASASDFCWGGRFRSPCISI